jgi:filamentous hemagglutinin family protein
VRHWLIAGLPLALAAWCATVPSAYAAGPLPRGGQFVAGSGTINGSGTTLTIDQLSARGVIDWSSFSIGNGSAVNFNNGNGATLNRITGSDASMILGKLSATGSLYLINPQGVLIGPRGVVTTGGRFVASTLDLSNDAFMQGNAATLSALPGGGNGSVINLGAIGSSGGDVLLIARRTVANRGTIDAPQGTAELVAGEQVLLQDAAGSRQVFVQSGSGGSVLNQGTIRAAQISLQAADGNVYALAGNHAAIRATGTATRDARVWLVAEGGQADVRGDISAVSADGSGGTVETSAQRLSVRDATVRAGTWKLAAPDLTVDAGTAGALQRSLNTGTSIQALATGGSSGSGSGPTAGATAANGDLAVASNLQWNGGANLTLSGARNVTVAPKVTLSNTGSGKLTLRADANGVDNGGSVTNQGTLDWSHSTGTIASLYDMTGRYSAGTVRTNSGWSAAPYSGLLTQTTGYRLVNTLADLQNVSSDLAGTYALGRDIDASASRFTTLATAATPFTGQFDGFGHTIDQLFPHVTGTGLTIPGGLFGVIGANGVVRNLNVTNSGSFSGLNGPSGILAGQNLGLVTYVFTSGNVDTASYFWVGGGLVGVNDGTVERSSSSASVGSQGVAGGLVGTNNGKIMQSFATGHVTTGNHGTAGGLVGINSGTISQSYATGSVGPLKGGGGLVNTNTSSGVIEQSFATGPVGVGGPPLSAWGGIASTNQGMIADNVYWDKETSTRSASVANGTPLPAANGLTTAQMSRAASFGPSWDFGPTGTWALPAGATHPVLSWQLAH